MTTEQWVFLVALMGGSFLFGMDVGHGQAREQIAAQCIAQPGEKLVATHQNRDGVICSFARAYGTATKQRKAKT